MPDKVWLGPDGHADYPHEPFTLYDCPACENGQCNHTNGEGDDWCVSSHHPGANGVPGHREED